MSRPSRVNAHAPSKAKSRAVSRPTSTSTSTSLTPSSAHAQHALVSALETYGPAPGARVMLDAEMEAAKYTIEQSGVYVTWRSMTGNDCTRVGPHSMCFCGHRYDGHHININKDSYPCATTACVCQRFSYIPTRPEEVGEWWLPRRRDFDIRTWAAKCKCKHTHQQHHAQYMSCRACGCSQFNSAFLCAVCDKHSQQHQCVWETEAERRASSRPTGLDYIPLAEVPTISRLVFNRAQTPSTGTTSTSIPPRIKHDTSQHAVVKIQAWRGPCGGDDGGGGSGGGCDDVKITTMTTNREPGRKKAGVRTDYTTPSPYLPHASQQSHVLQQHAPYDETPIVTKYSQAQAHAQAQASSPWDAVVIRGWSNRRTGSPATRLSRGPT